MVLENSRSRSLVFFWSRFVAKRYILEQKCQKGRIGTWMLGSRWNNFQPSTPTLRATMHSVTDIQTDGRTDGQQAYANSRSYCVAVRSAKKCAITTYNNNSAKLKQQCYWCQTELERWLIYTEGKIYKQFKLWTCLLWLLVTPFQYQYF